MNRRSFLYNAAIGTGAVLLWNSCAGAPSTQDRDTLKEIKTIWEKEPSDPADVQRLKDILLPWHGALDDEIRDEAVRALAIQADLFVIPTYKEAFLRYRKDRKFLENFIPLLALNFTVNPEGRVKIIYFLWHLSTPLTSSKTLDLPYSSIAQAEAVYRFLGNVSFRAYLMKLHNVQTAAHRSGDQISDERKCLVHLGEIDPSLKEYAVTPENINLWQAELASGNDTDKIIALRNLHRVYFIKGEKLLGLLKNGSLEFQKAIVPVLGNNFALTPEIQTVLVDYLESTDSDLVVAAAKALRFKENLPAKEIVKILKQHRKRDPELGQQLDDILLSTLVSEDVALAEVFATLVWNILSIDSNKKKDKIKRINEIRIWYWRLSNNRKEHANYPYVRLEGMNSFVYSSDIRYERNKRNERLRLAMPSMPYDIQDMFIAFLRQIPAIAGASENYYDDRLAHDLKDLEKIYEELRLKGDSILFRKK